MENNQKPADFPDVIAGELRCVTCKKVIGIIETPSNEEDLSPFLKLKVECHQCTTAEVDITF